MATTAASKLVTTEEYAMFVNLLIRARQVLIAGAQVLQDRLRSWTEPPSTALALGSLHDLARSKPHLVLENALLLCWLRDHPSFDQARPW